MNLARFNTSAWNNLYLNLKPIVVKGNTVVFNFKGTPNYVQWQNMVWNMPMISPLQGKTIKTAQQLTTYNPHNPIGTGPYKLDTSGFDVTTRVVWAKRTHWWAAVQGIAPSPAPKYIIDLVNTSNTNSLSAVLAGVEDLNNNYLPGVSKLVDAGKVHTYFAKAPYMLSANTAWLEPNTTVEPLNDPVFRKAHQAGLDFYERLVDDLLEAGIRPFPTLYHWDLPQALEDEGGWTVRATAEAFADFAAVVASRLGDRVQDWTTHNEPFCSSWLGYGLGLHAPGRATTAEALLAAHHVLLSHGWAVDVLRQMCPAAEVGIVLDSWPAYPAHDDDADREAARVADGIHNRWFFDPVLRGEYPADMLEHFGRLAPPVRNGDLAAIGAPLDFVGINNYSRMFVRADPRGGPPLEVRSPAAPLTDMGWEIYPDGLAEVLLRLHQDYAAPSLYVTENGASFADVRTHDGRIHDNERRDYVAAYIDAMAHAVACGAPVRGYFVWSLLDNFEWAYGYSKRFGLVYVDYPTLERIPKDSFYWYRDLLARSPLRRTASPRVIA